VKIEVEIYMDEDPDTPPKKLGFCCVRTNPDSWCGRAIFDNDIEAVEIEDHKGWICGDCVDSLIAAIFRGKLETMKPVPVRFGTPGKPGAIKGIRVGKRDWQL